MIIASKSGVVISPQANATRSWGNSDGENGEGKKTLKPL